MTPSDVQPDKLFSLLRADSDAVECFQVVRNYGPKYAYIAAGFVRNRFWDNLYPGKNIIRDTDVDVIYFDPNDVSKEAEQAFERELARILPVQNWQVRNQARMHVRSENAPFHDVSHALTHWPEVATAIGVRMNDVGDMECLAPFGLDDLYNHILRISPIGKAKDPDAFESRLASKNWLTRWPNLQVIR